MIIKQWGIYTKGLKQMKWVGYELFNHGRYAVFEYDTYKRICFTKDQIKARMKLKKTNNQNINDEREALASWLKEEV